MEVHALNLDVSKRKVKKRLNHALEISCCNAGMDIFENRRRWLAYWIEQDFGGDRKKVEQATGYSRSQISQFLSNTYQNGESPQEKAARRIEHKFGKPERIMETPAPGPGETVPVLTARYDPASESQENLPPYVAGALDAIRAAHRADVPREVFDAIQILFSLLKIPESGSITAQQKDETVKKPATSIQSITADAERAVRDAESRLATRDEGKRAARKPGERRSKGVRH